MKPAAPVMEAFMAEEAETIKLINMQAELKKEQQRIYSRNHYHANKEDILTRQKEYRASNPMRRREYERAYRQQHMEKIQQYSKEYYNANSDRLSEYQRSYRAQHKKDICSYQKQYRAEHAAAIAEYQRAYRQKQKEARLAAQAGAAGGGPEGPLAAGAARDDAPAAPPGTGTAA